jgi:acyl-CoA thioesterase I
MVDSAKKSGAQVLLAGMRLPPNYGPYAEQFVQSFADIAKTKKTAPASFPARTGGQSPRSVSG